VDFTWSEDQLLFQATLRDFLAAECTPELLRGLWAAGASHSPALWAKLAELGIPGLLVPEAFEGMGLSEVDAVLLFEELGRAAVAEPVIATAGVAVPLLGALEARELRDRWLKRIAVGEALVAVAELASPLVADADVAHLLLLPRGDELHAVLREDARLTPQPANDPSRRLFTLDFDPSEGTRVAAGEAGLALQRDALARGALFAAAEQLGVCDRLLEMASAYAGQRRQFGQPIGSFQALKHMLANAKVKLEYARPVVQRAAWSLARGASARGLHASMAKLAASDAATLAARVALQVHGAIGYTWEQDLHIWMRRAWSLEQAFGRSSFHRQRVEEAVLRGRVRLGPGETFRGD
jgi:alkylation response protein AidB-like acyl-CoA dehydrogenase